MRHLTTHQSIRDFVLNHRTKGARIGFVPTMGYLHDGHLSLMDIAKSSADIVIASIFVNPTQFAANEDLDQYPSDLSGDLEKLAEVGADAVFLPAAKQIYDGGPSVAISIPELTSQLCGRDRPTHFAGVCQVVLKLFNLVQCDVAVFGEKDFQQLAIIRRMVADLFLPMEIIGGPIMREEDGLAMSSRNVNLSVRHREQATVLYQSLQSMRTLVQKGETQVERVLDHGLSILKAAPDVQFDYLQVVHNHTLQPLTEIDLNLQNARALVAARFGATRLIDNLALLSH